MGIGASVFLMALGAVLVWGIEASFNGINLDAVGVVLIIAGLVGLLWSLMLMQRMRTRSAIVAPPPAAVVDDPYGAPAVVAREREVVERRDRAW